VDYGAMHRSLGLVSPSTGIASLFPSTHPSNYFAVRPDEAFGGLFFEFVKQLRTHSNGVNVMGESDSGRSFCIEDGRRMPVTNLIVF
jgi:hypothetical protein